MTLIDMPTEAKASYKSLCEIALDYLYALDKQQNLWYIKYNPFVKKLPTAEKIRAVEELYCATSDSIGEYDILVDVDTIFLVQRICNELVANQELKL